MAPLLNREKETRHGFGRGMMTGSIQVQVKAFATFRGMMPVEFTVGLDDTATVGTLITLLIDRFDGLKTAILDEHGEVRPYVIILKNGRNIHFLQQLDTPLGNGDIIAFFSAVTGG